MKRAIVLPTLPSFPAIDVGGPDRAALLAGLTFVEGATEHKGSWWPDWLSWLKQDPTTVKAAGARIPGKGKLKPVEDAPGSYVKAR